MGCSFLSMPETPAPFHFGLRYIFHFLALQKYWRSLPVDGARSTIFFSQPESEPANGHNEQGAEQDRGAAPNNPEIRGNCLVVALLHDDNIIGVADWRKTGQPTTFVFLLAVGYGIEIVSAAALPGNIGQ